MSGTDSFSARQPRGGGPREHYSIEVEAPDLRPFASGNAGIPHVWSFAADAPGPHVLVSAIVHGNEITGACVLAELLRREVRPRRGRLTLAFMNVAAYERFDPRHPLTSRYVDEDFNRLWAPERLAPVPDAPGTRPSVELARARQVLSLVESADYLLDLHSMQQDAEPLTLCGATARGRSFAVRLGHPSVVVADAGHAAGPRMRDYGRFGDPLGSAVALLVECGQHWRRATLEVAREVTWRFLLHLGLTTREEAARAAPAALETRPAPRVIEVTTPVTARTNSFRFTRPFRGLEVVPRAGTIIGYDADLPVATPHDDCVLVMPSRRLVRGGTAVRLGRYVHDEEVRS